MLLSILVIVLFMVIRRVLTLSIGLMTKEKNASEDMFFQFASEMYTRALVLLLFCLLLHYSALNPVYLFTICLSILALLYAIRVVKLLIYGYSIYGFSLFHLVLYLCAVEIIPLAVFVKIIVKS